jgi:cytoskeletal protein RodZ
MKQQIAIIGVGLAIAAGVAYAELKPNNSTSPSQTSSPAPSESASSAPSSTQVQEAPASQPLQPKLKNPNSKPQISGGEHERSESREHEGREREGGEDD